MKDASKQTVMSNMHRSLSSKNRIFYNMWGLILVPFLIHANWHDTYGVEELFLIPCSVGIQAVSKDLST